MEQILCKICGQPLVEVREGFYKCSSCLSEFKKEATVSAEQKQLQEAYELIRNGNFSDAEALCTTLLKTKNTSYEAYWVRALAKNGVIFVRDIGDLMVPTCQNIVEEHFFSDADVQKAIELAPTEIAENYRSQGERIEAIRKEWFDIASKEAPYDVFICFKDSDKENGFDRTRDSEYAQDLYNYLGTKGLNVFFSRVSLMGKVSEHYEPYIYNALKTAKVMIVYGEKAEYFNATWLRNEWSRFIARMQRENMPKDSLIVAYRGVDPYRIPSALLGGRQGLDLAKPSAFNILVEKVVDTVAKAKKVITLERKEIKGGQMSKKASTIMQVEIQKRTIGANTPVKLDFSLESKLRMVHNYLAQGMWQEAEDALSVVLEQAPQNGDALLCKLLLKTKNQTLDNLMHANHFGDVELLQGILDSADQETAQKILDMFYGLKKLPTEEYLAILRAILPYEYENREHNILTVFQDSLNHRATELFDLLLQTLDPSEVDRYITLNKQMLVNLLDGNEYQKARKYISNILAVNESNLDVLRVDCEIALANNDGTFIEKFETLLKYAKSTNDYVQFFLDKVLDDRKITVAEVEVLKKLLTYYKGELIKLKETLLLITSLLIKENLFKEAEYFDNLILAEDSQCANAWLYLCLIGTESTSITSMADSDVPMNKCRGFDEYCSLVNADKQREVFAVLKQQQGKITEKKQKKYNSAITLQNKGSIEDLEQAVAIFSTISDFKDSSTHIMECEKQIEEIKNAKEQMKLARAKAKKKAIKITKISVASIVTIALISILMTTLIIPWIKFNNAISLMEKGKYSEARTILVELDGFGSSEKDLVVLDAIIDNLIVYNNENDTITFNEPTKNGYTFTGWTGPDISQPTMKVTIPAERYVEGEYTANWKPNEYTFTLNANGGTVSSSSISANYDALYTLPTPTRDYYTFAGWYDGTKKYENGTWDKASNVTLTAKWTPVSYTITYNLSGGTNSSQNANDFTVESSKISLKDPTRTGYKFIGWYKESSYSNKVTEIAAGSHENISLYAKWEIINYTITYNLNGGTISGTKKTTFTVNDLPLTLPSATKSGLTFLNWSKGSFDGEAISKITEVGNVTIVASYMDPNLKLRCSKDSTYYIVDGYSGSASNIVIPAYYNGKPIKTISSSAFFKVSFLTSIQIPSTVTEIGASAFQGCDNLVEIIIPEGVTDIKDKTFMDCSKIKKVVLPNSLKTIGEWSFYNCESLRNITLPSSLTSIGYVAFSRSGLQSITIPSGVKTIQGSFSNCDELKTVILNEGLEEIGSYTFQESSSLTKIIIPSTVKIIPGGYFSPFKGTNLTIYCRDTMIKGGWESNWNYYRPVIWGYTGN